MQLQVPPDQAQLPLSITFRAEVPQEISCFELGARVLSSEASLAELSPPWWTTFTRTGCR